MTALFLLGIVTANVVAARFGPIASVGTAFLLIGFDLVARDRLHRKWQNRGLAPRMGALILAGAALSFLVNAQAGRVGLASAAAFAAATTVDALTFAALRDRSELVRVNGSNVPAALVDSLLFPTLAFGALLPAIVLAQFAAKVLGGAFWSLVLARNAHSPN